jgi:quinoprotein glucose dehydrogenase
MISAASPWGSPPHWHWSAQSSAASSTNSDWPAYLGDKGRSLYSPLAQINRSNVAQLKVAWTYDTGDKGEYQANNLIVAGVLYTASPSRKVIALDAGTGRELWKWDPAPKGPGLAAAGSAAWCSGKMKTAPNSDSSPGLAIISTRSIRNPAKTIRSFGQNGSIHLGTGPGCGGDTRRRPEHAGRHL